MDGMDGIDKMNMIEKIDKIYTVGSVFFADFSGKQAKEYAKDNWPLCMIDKMDGIDQKTEWTNGRKLTKLTWEKK